MDAEGLFKAHPALPLFLNLSNFCSEMGKATECTYILAAGRLCVCEREREY
jgi:hypothetical protein